LCAASYPLYLPDERTAAYGLWSAATLTYSIMFSSEWPPSIRSAKAIGSLLVIGIAHVLLVGCVRPARVPIEGSPAEIAALEARVATSPSAVEERVRLAALYRSMDRADEGRTLIEEALQRDPEHPAGLVVLGLTYEDLGLRDEARGAYEGYLEVGTSEAVAAGVRGRLAVLARAETEQAIRAALAAGEPLAPAGSEPPQVVVLPFSYSGADPNGAALARAMGELLAIGLARDDQITVTERQRVQLVLSEMGYVQGDVLDATMAGSVGWTLGAPRVVRGLVTGSAGRLRIELSAMDVGSSEVRTVVVEQDSSTAAYGLQRQLEASLYTLLSSTALRFEGVASRSAGALLQFGQGLLAEDRADHATAVLYFGGAAELDPLFAAASRRAEAARLLVTGLAVSPAALSGLAFAEVGAPPLAVFDVQRVVPTTLGARDPAAEVLGTESIGGGTGLDIIIRLPQE
jgi:tetratricopeptide (TPR) repeat protein